MPRPRSNRWITDTRGRRRHRHLRPLMVLGILFAAAPPIIEIFIENENPDASASALSSMVLLLALATLQSPFARFGDASEPPLDEFECAALAEATRRAFAITIGMAASLFIWLWATSRFGGPAPTTPSQWFALGVSFVVIAGTLPAVLTEFAVPLPPESDEAEDI